MSPARSTLTNKKPTPKGIKVKLKDRSPEAKAFLRKRNSYYRGALTSLIEIHKIKNGVNKPITPKTLLRLQRNARKIGDKSMYIDSKRKDGDRLKKYEIEESASMEAHKRNTKARKLIRQKRKSKSANKK